MTNCLFCKIVAGQEPSRIIHEDDRFIAFLTPYPNTNGFTVVATKDHYGSYIFDLPHEVYLDFLLFSQGVGKLLDAALEVKRTGMICEGMGVDHAHIKLIPLHGLQEGKWVPIRSNNPVFYNTYPGYIASHDGPRLEDEKLDLIYNKILNSKKSH